MLAAETTFRQWSINTQLCPLSHRTRGHSDSQMPRLPKSGPILTPCQPPQFRSSKHSGCSQGHVTPPTLWWWQPWGGRGLGAGGRGRGPSCFSWEVLNPFLLTQPQGLACQGLPNLRYVLEGCLAGPPSRWWWGAYSGPSPPQGPQRPLCPRWRLSFHDESVPTWQRPRPAAHSPGSPRLRIDT